MSDREEVQENPGVDRLNHGDEVARLLRAMGPRPAVPEERASRVRGALHAHWQRTVSARRRARWLAWGAVPLVAAAAWVVLIASGILEKTRMTPTEASRVATLERSVGTVSWLNHPSPDVGESLGAGSTLETGPDGRVAMRLTGGASLRIDLQTRLRLLSGDELLLDQGAVYVDTGATAAAATTVTVRTAAGTVRDIGTQFQVRVSTGGVRLSVREGVAAFEHRGASHQAPAGTQLTILEDGSLTSGRVLPYGPEWDWIQETPPPFDLEGRLLGEYLGWIGRETGLRIEYADPALLAETSGVRLHGSVEGLRPDETLEAVLPTCGLRHRLSGDALIIERSTPGAREHPGSMPELPRNPQ